MIVSNIQQYPVTVGVFYTATNKYRTINLMNLSKVTKGTSARPEALRALGPTTVDAL